MGLFSKSDKGAGLRAEGDAAMAAAKAFAKKQFEEKQASFDPYRKLGIGMRDKYTDYFNNGGTEFDPNSVQTDPGYAFREKQGMNAIQNSAMAKGGLLSGNTLKATQDYGQNLASQEYDNAYNRQYGAFKDKYNLMNDMLDRSQIFRDQWNGVRAQDQTGNDLMMKANNLYSQAAKASAKGSGFGKALGSIGSIAGTAFGGPIGGMIGGGLGGMLGGGGWQGGLQSGLGGIMGGGSGVGGGGFGGMMSGLGGLFG